MTTMRVVQVSRPNGPLEIVERQVPEPGAGSVRIRVQACGICHSDSFTKEGTFPGIHRSPGNWARRCTSTARLRIRRRSS